MALHAKTKAIIEAAHTILGEGQPMTLRQVYYQLVSRQVIENARASYMALSNALVRARQDGLIPWDWIEDRTRRPRRVAAWQNLRQYLGAVSYSYRRDVWNEQPRLIEVWLEKDALSGVVGAELEPYGVTLNVGRGYDGWASIRNAAERYGSGEMTWVLYFGDLDPSGEDMVRSLRERLAFFGCRPEITKIALTIEDVERYDLPPDPTKKTDTRRAAHVKRYGDRSWELDALPANVLRERIHQEIDWRIDQHALEETRRLQAEEQQQLSRLLRGA